MTSNDQLWVRHPEEVWTLAEAVHYKGDKVDVRDGYGSTFEVALADTHHCDPSHLRDMDDIAHMNNMHEAPLLGLLKRRYMKDQIYTFTGDILISINPYKFIDGLYCVGEPDAPDWSSHEVPHVYSVGDRAYRQMMSTDDPRKKNQSLIVSGESGAGKTEACKHIMRYLASLSELHCKQALRRESAAAETIKIEKKVLDCNPFLEAFGNAKTVRNDNSSRFGKFLKIEYARGRILGASMRHYLLEKARVVSPNPEERNYHIFYQMCAGISDAERAEFELKRPEDYFYLHQSGCLTVDGIDDAQEFAEVREALTTVGIAPEEQHAMFRVLAGILHLGNVEFEDDSQDQARVSNPEVAAKAAALFGNDMLPVKLVQRLMKVKGRGSAYTVHLSATKAAAARDALAKMVYERIFSWLIHKSNQCLSGSASNPEFIGILDIFGFEIFLVNSFEQLCINFANEKLQNLFNHHIFVMEQEMYKSEVCDVCGS